MMPDLERFADSLRSDFAATEARKQWARGYAAGKYRARVEVALIVLAFVFIQAALIGYLG